MAFLSFPYGWTWDAPPPPPESVRTYGRSYADVITKFFRLDGLPIFLTHGASLARFARWSSATNFSYQWCFAGALRALKLRYQTRAYTAGYQTIPKFWNKQNCRIFARPLNVSTRVTFGKVQVKVNFIFRQIIFFLGFRAQSAKTRCLRFAICSCSK